MSLRRAARLVALALAVAAPAAAQSTTVDWLVRGGSIYDGSGAAPLRADLGIRGDRIVFVGDAVARGVTGERTIDATGLVVTPGFIDAHTHAGDDLSQAATAGVPHILLQGVTTVVLGNDGGGPVDVSAARERLAARGVGVNVAFLVGFGTIRRAVLGMSSREPTRAELDRMRALARQGMTGGAFGLSTGLYYAPQSYAATDEVVAVAKAAAESGGYYDTHLRDESSYTIGLLGAVREALEIGRRAGVPVHLAHIKALGVDVWGQSDSIVAIVTAARRAGQRVTADQYPYTASGTSLTASLLPRWAEVGGREQMLKRLDDRELAPKLRSEVADNLRRRGGPASFLITSGPRTGQRLDAIARETGAEPIDAAFAMIRQAPTAVASFNMNEKDVERLMRAEFVVTGSDGSAGHPRRYGAFPRLFREYVSERGVLSFTDAVARSSARTGELIGLERRGRLADGWFADVAVIDSASFADRATYERPTEPAVGVRYLFVNGSLVVDQGRVAPVRGGRVLSRGSAGGGRRRQP
ncbi:MAG: amidohydrolase family protein [Gemmatimonadales bacterium]